LPIVTDPPPAAVAPKTAGLAGLPLFIGLSGIGWLIDTGVYLTIVALGGRIAVASIAGGLCGATFAFLGAHRLVFRSTERRLTLKLVAYQLYSLCLIVIAGILVERLTFGLAAFGSGFSINPPLPVYAFAAKCLSTPFLLLANFVVARAMLARSRM
jgi:putative flippase GtrA